jgi:hypothetical protein
MRYVRNGIDNQLEAMSTTELPTQKQFLAWFVCYTCIGAVFDSAVASLLVPTEKSTFLYVLPRTWVFRSFVLLTFRAYMGSWNDNVQRIDWGQEFVFYVVLPVVVLGLPVLPLAHLPKTSNGFITNAVWCLLSYVALLGLLANIGISWFVVRFAIGNFVPSSPVVSRGSVNRLSVIHMDLAYVALLALMTWGYIANF